MSDFRSRCRNYELEKSGTVIFYFAAAVFKDPADKRINRKEKDIIFHTNKNFKSIDFNRLEC